MKNFAQLKKNLKEDFINLKVIKVAILADTATQLLKQALEGRGYDKGYNVKIWEAAFQQTELQVFTQTSELYGFEPEFVIIFHSSHKLLSKYNKLAPDQYTLLAANELKLIHNIHSTISNRLNAKIIYYNYPEIDDSVFGNFSNKIESSFLFQLRKLNYELMLFAAQNSNFHICDISTIQNRIGKHNFFHPATYINTEMVLSIDALPAIASKTVDLISVLNGSLKKCVILDLDNTLWGGVIGDDGLEKIEIGSLGIGKAYTEFQYWIKKLKNRGIILAVCSKNYESVAKEPFKNHPDMILQLDDFSIFVANWENKVDNIRHIQKVLNIGFDSMVFIDDNPFERNLVREQLTEVTVPELPEDPADYLEYLYSLNLFETASFSEEESGRSKLYQLAAERNVAQRSFTNEDEFLQSLGMIALVESFNEFNTPRVAQLSQRSNQFNLRTVRYSESDIASLSRSGFHFTFSFTLEDKFGNHGLICAVVLRKEDPQTLFIESWFMSCRVLNHGMENFVFNTISGFAKDNGFLNLKGEFIPTGKNNLVQNLYFTLGFGQQGDYWECSLNHAENKKSFIQMKA